MAYILLEIKLNKLFIYNVFIHVLCMRSYN